MYVNSESANNANSIVESTLDFLDGKIEMSTNDIDKVRSALRDVLEELSQKPYKPYNDISTAVGNYVELRDQLSIERKSWETHEEDVKSEMTRISMWLRDKGDELGVDSFNTQYGTAYRNVQTSYRIESWDDYSRWILETNNLQCLEKRPAKLAVKEIYDETGELPPGLYTHVEVEFNVRRPTKAKAKAAS